MAHMHTHSFQRWGEREWLLETGLTGACDQLIDSKVETEKSDNLTTWLHAVMWPRIITFTIMSQIVVNFSEAEKYLL